MSPTNSELYLDLMKKALIGSLYQQSEWGPLPKLGPIRSRATARLAKKGYVTVNPRAFTPADVEDGKIWGLLGVTMVGQKRLDNVQFCVESVLKENIPGDLVETGVWKGGTTIFMRAILKANGVTDRKVWAADSFEGLPRPKDSEDGWDLSEEARLKVSLEEVQDNFRRFGLLDDTTVFLKGWFCDTLPLAPIKAISVLRLDGDLYTSTMDGLTNLYDKVSPGGYIIADDYFSWPGQRRAITEFLAARNLAPDIKQIDWTGAYWRVE